MIQIFTPRFFFLEKKPCFRPAHYASGSSSQCAPHGWLLRARSSCCVGVDGEGRTACIGRRRRSISSKRFDRSRPRRRRNRLHLRCRSAGTPPTPSCPPPASGTSASSRTSTTGRARWRTGCWRRRAASCLTTARRGQLPRRRAPVLLLLLVLLLLRLRQRRWRQQQHRHQRQTQPPAEPSTSTGWTSSASAGSRSNLIRRA